MAPRPPRKRSHNFNNTGSASFKRTAMIDMHSEKHFRYGLKALFSKYEVDPRVSEPIGGMIFAKGSRNSIEEAKDYVDDKVREGLIGDRVAADIYDLLDRYGTWR